jgi:tetratricopeptide (TPR) repeat protein
LKRLAKCPVILGVLPLFLPSLSRCAPCTLACCLAFAGAALLAHPGLDEGLSRLNTLIAAAPNDADLYLDRGDLYAQHDELVSAEANYLRAAELAPQHPRLDRALGTLEFAQGRLVSARKHFDAALARNPQDAESLVLRARTLSALNLRAAALADYELALKLIENPPPELYLERAALHDAPGEALRSLDEGLERLGPVISLQIRALAIEESSGAIDAALRRVDQLAAQTERKDIWLKRRGDILSRAGRAHEADAAYAAALEAIAALPVWLRESPDTQRLTTELTRLKSTRS